MNENTIPVFIESIIEETKLVKRFVLAPLNAAKFSAFSGGSHITTYCETDNGILIRPYSLTNSPISCQNYQIAIRLNEASKGGSLHWHHKLKIGDKLRVSYPKNHFPLSFKAKHHVFYAAGIGITPFLTMMAELTERGVSFDLHYAAKSKELCAFYHEIKLKYPKQSHFYFSNEHNRLNTSSLLNHKIGTHVYFCGPESFISTFKQAAIEIGYPKSSIHLERFTPVQPTNRSPFQVKLTSGQTFQVAKDQSLLEALLENGQVVPYSCRVGRCGTCELHVIEGEVDHNDSFLSLEQRKNSRRILTCVSRAKSDKIVIDI